MITSYHFGSITVDGAEYETDIMIVPQGEAGSCRVISDWWREEGHELSLGDMGSMLESSPDLIVVGSGASGMMKVAREVSEHLMAEGIELKVERTEAACRIFNELISSKAKAKRVGALLHLTC